MNEVDVFYILVPSAIVFILGWIVGNLGATPNMKARFTDHELVGMIYAHHKRRIEDFRRKFNKLHPNDTPADYADLRKQESDEDKKFAKFESAIVEYFGVKVR